jgi:hypothetical protein
VLNDSLFFDVSLSGHFGPLEKKMQGVLLVGSKQTIRVIPRMETINKYSELLKRNRYVIDQFVVYNRRVPWERTWVVVRMSMGRLTTFWNASVLKEHYLILEGRIISFLREVLVKFERELLVMFCRIVDQLVYFGTREHGGNEALLLANLLFPALYEREEFQLGPLKLQRYVRDGEKVSEAWDVELVDWISPLGYFLSFYLEDALTKPLRELYASLIL